jgi:uncharacterized membrane protein YhhN
MPQTGVNGGARLLVGLSLAFGLSYILVLGLHWPFGVTLAWKTTGVALLAIAAAVQARESDGRLLALVLAFGALGDLLLEAAGQIAGALAFIAAHIAAILLYWRNRRTVLAGSQRALVVITVPFAVMIAWLLPADRSQAAGVALYALFVAAMAAAAWASRFPRFRTGIGAMMFLASDLLIFARMGPLEGAFWASVAIWLLYYLGQLLIYLGVRRTLDADPVSASPS